jgi:CubicO group peptidase (beta-lactamase class C family)
MLIRQAKSCVVLLSTVFLLGFVLPGHSAGAEMPTPASTIVKGAGLNNYWPTYGWKSCAPEAVGMDAKKLSGAVDYASSPEFRTDGLVIIKNGYVVAEKYFEGFGPDDTHTSYSMAKSFTSALVGIAVDKGLVAGLDEKICRYYDAWDCNDKNDLRSRITIRHALTLTTGLEWSEDWTTWDFATNDALKMSFSDDFVEYMSEREGRYEPGEYSYYSTGDPMLLSQVLQKSTGMTAFEFGKKNLFTPLNFSQVKWDADSVGHTATAMGLHATVSDYAKFGYLLLNKGYWENRQIISEQWVTRSTQTDPDVNMSNTYGYLWHVNLAQKLKDRGSLVPTDSVPVDAFMAAGVLGQAIVVIPSEDLVIVKVANQRKERIDMGKLVTLVLAAVL